MLRRVISDKDNYRRRITMDNLKRIMNEQQLIELGYFDKPDIGVCLKCKCIKIEALPYDGSWSVPICRCSDRLLICTLDFKRKEVM